MLATAERLPAKYLVKEEAPKTISSPEQHQACISRLLELQRKAHRSTEETETAKLLVVAIADYEAKRFVVEKASGVQALRELMAANGQDCVIDLSLKFPHGLRKGFASRVADPHVLGTDLTTSCT